MPFVWNEKKNKFAMNRNIYNFDGSVLNNGMIKSPERFAFIRKDKSRYEK